MPESSSILPSLYSGGIGHRHFRPLHICMAGLFAGCRVYFLDNNYGKLSGVYHQFLSDHPRAYLLPHSELSVFFPEIFSLLRK